ncbi:hypothetical protein EV213_13039 [Aureibacillus halotolerans]|uniref:Uncharacterized protein n=1 Tax=Aureibacillus halotolerans TaxID=1508390 RepID=A0A4R6TQ64_9BACI|nr:hypothetical protein EV213_13039 [Aureibacillus halotolerans]
MLSFLMIVSKHQKNKTNVGAVPKVGAAFLCGLFLRQIKGFVAMISAESPFTVREVNAQNAGGQ